MKSLAELQAIRDRVKSSVVVRENNDVDYRIVVGMATCGIAAGARPVLNAASEEVENASFIMPWSPRPAALASANLSRLSRFLRPTAKRQPMSK